ncbi:hypothetical protein ANN_16957 [Periplaneta americana]|uniref:RNase H type-1 domain-containing protein n=1 Tax=Periplaneta americana TaxID=6978 RepID=A0ABQ8SRJ6_PERAM|nr:hypothetical protein ANN_16957 [Periplaneta americana]
MKVRICKTVTFVLYGCETWTLTLREEKRLRMFENKVHRKIFGAKRNEVTGEWRKLHSAELHGFYSSPNIIRNIKAKRLRWAMVCSTYVGLQGNEQVDMAAKEATHLPIQDMDIDTWNNDIATHLKTKLKHLWYSNWLQTSTSKVRKIRTASSLFYPTKHLSRRNQFLINRLRTGQTKLTHGYLLKKPLPVYSIKLNIYHEGIKFSSTDYVLDILSPHMIKVTAIYCEEFEEFQTNLWQQVRALCRMKDHLTYQLTEVISTWYEVTGRRTTTTACEKESVRSVK